VAPTREATQKEKAERRPPPVAIAKPRTETTSLKQSEADRTLSKLIAEHAEAGASPARDPWTPAARFERATRRLADVVLPTFQRVIDDVDDRSARAAAEYVLGAWLDVQEAYDAFLRVPEAATPAEWRLTPAVHDAYYQARSRTLVGVSTQLFRGRPLLDRLQLPPGEPEINLFVLEEGNAVAGTIIAAKRLVSILVEPRLDPLAQWEAVGILRQHQNAVEFAYLQAVVDERRVWPRFAAFTPMLRRMVDQLTAGQRLMRAEGLTAPSTEPATLTLKPKDGKVRLLQPLTPRDLAQELYGDADRWESALRPFNREALANVGAEAFIDAGTELFVDVQGLVPQFRSVFLSVAAAREELAAKGADPYLKLDHDPVIAVGNAIKASVLWPNSVYAPQSLEWWADVDPAVAREHWLAVGARIKGPLGLLMIGREVTSQTTMYPHDTSWEFKAEYPGRYVINCRMSAAGEKPRLLSRAVTVLTLAEKSIIDFSRALPTQPTPAAVRNEIKRELQRIPGGARSSDELQELQNKLAETLDRDFATPEEAAAARKKIEQSIVDVKQRLSVVADARKRRGVEPAEAPELTLAEELSELRNKLYATLDRDFKTPEEAAAARKRIEGTIAGVKHRISVVEEAREKREELEARLERVEKKIAEIGNRNVEPIRAVYTSGSEQRLSVALSIFVGFGERSADDRLHKLELWDLTTPRPQVYSATAETASQAFYKLLDEFARAAPYPKGMIRFQVTPDLLQYPGFRLSPHIVEHATNGGMGIETLMRWGSMGALGVGAVAGLAGQPEVAIPAFKLSAYLAGAAALADIAQRIEHGSFEWDLQTGMDLLDIATALTTAGLSRAVTSLVPGVGRVAVVPVSVRALEGAQAGIGYTQLAIMGGMHLVQISAAAAYEGPDRNERLRDALLHALADGALFLIVHKAGQRLREGAVEERGQGRLGMATPSGRGLRPGSSSAAERGTHTAYGEWSERMLREGMGAKPVPPAPVGGEPLRPNTTVKRDIATMDEAYRLYQEALARAGDREVGIFLDRQTGLYAVRVGTEFNVGPPPDPNTMRYAPLLHYHPNLENVLTNRMPSPMDIQLALRDFGGTGRPTTLFVEYDIPGSGRARVAVTVGEGERIRVRFERPEGTARPDQPRIYDKSFENLRDYEVEWGRRKRYVEPRPAKKGDPPTAYDEMLGDVERVRDDLRGRPRDPDDELGMARPSRRKRTSLEDVHVGQNQEYWQGRETDSAFARHRQTLSSIAKTLAAKLKALAKTGLGHLLPTVDESVLRRPVDLFIRDNPELSHSWANLEKLVAVEQRERGTSDLRQRMQEFLEGKVGAGARDVGSRTPDIVEFLLDRGVVVVTDITAHTDPLHAFKTEFYKEAVRALLGGTGPAVYGLDIDFKPGRDRPVFILLD
jgi:hypothetical protein